MKKKTMYTELAYVLGLIILAAGTAIITVSNLGVSMIVAPAYLLHLKISPVLPFFSFGMAEYTLQGVIIIVMCLVLRRFHFSYLFSFVTAVLYGFCLDGCLFALSSFVNASLQTRLFAFILGQILATIGVAFFFRTYISPEAYELFVKKVSAKFGFDIHKFKIGYDAASLVLSVVMSFAFFGFGVFRGIGIGTLASTFFNGALIAFWSKCLDRCFEFKDALSFKKYFDE